MWRRKICLVVAMAGLLCGCNDAQGPQPTGPVVLKTTTETITDAELQRFLRLVSRLPDGEVPEFTAFEQPHLDTLMPPKLLVSEFRDRYRNLCDPVRQGEVWDSSLDLSRSTQQEGWTSAQLAAFIRCLSCAVMKAELTRKHDLKAIEQQCRHEINSLVAELDADDQRPRSTMTEAFMNVRERKLERLGRMVALLEFIQQLKPIPPENLELVQKYAAQIQTLLPETTRDPFEDPFGDEPPGDQEIQPVNYQTPSLNGRSKAGRRK